MGNHPTNYTHMYKHADAFLDQPFLVYVIQMAHSPNKYKL